MEIIHCPECGQEISDKATTCPHCGTPIFVCPECGHISVGNVTFCENCGFAMNTEKGTLQPQSVAGQQKKTSASAKVDIVGLWLKNNPQEGKKRKAIKHFTVSGKNCLEVVLLLLWLFFVFMPWNNLEKKDAAKVMDMILDYQNYYRYTWIMASVMILYFALGCLANIYAGMWIKRCIQWLNGQKIDIREALKRESSELFSSKVREYDNHLNVNNREVAVMYYSALKQTGLPIILDCIEKIIEFIISVILVCNLANLGNAMIANAVIGENMIQGFWWIVKGICSPALIVGCAVWLIYVLVRSFLILSDKKIGTYLKQIISE